jgi:plastocyanin
VPPLSHRDARVGASRKESIMTEKLLDPEIAAATAAAGRQPVAAQVRPNRMRVIVSNIEIVADNETPGLQPDKVWAVPGGTVLFVVKNQDREVHTVTIPRSHFTPLEKNFGGDATADPLLPSPSESVEVEPDGEKTLAFNVRRLDHFQFDRREPWMSKPAFTSMTYKFDIYTHPASGKAIPPLDPDLEIDRP